MATYRPEDGELREFDFIEAPYPHFDYTHMNPDDMPFDMIRESDADLYAGFKKVISEANTRLIEEDKDVIEWKEVVEIWAKMLHYGFSADVMSSSLEVVVNNSLIYG